MSMASSAFTSPLRLKDVDATDATMSDSSADAKLVNALIREVALNGGSVVAGRMLQLRQGVKGCQGAASQVSSFDPSISIIFCLFLEFQLQNVFFFFSLFGWNWDP